MKTLNRILLLALTLGWIGCGEELSIENMSEEESEELITHEQSLKMDMDLSWFNNVNDKVLLTFNFPSHQSGERYTICIRGVGSSGGWACEKRYPKPSEFGCYSGVCTAAYTVEAQGSCGRVQEVRVQEGLPPFYRETRWKQIGLCPHGGDFVSASGGYKAGCEVEPEAPAGTTGFTYDNHFYHHPSSPGYCPSGSTFDGHNCKVMPIPRGQGFVRWPGRFLYRPYNCPAP